MRILIFNWRDLDHPLAGGAEVYTDAVAREWVRMGHHVTLFSSEVTGRPSHEVHSNGYRVVRAGSRHSVYRRARQFWRREGKGNYDFVVDEINTRPFGCPRFVGPVPVLALIHQVAREVWFHELPWLGACVGRYILEPFWLRLYRNVEIVTVSESSRQSLESLKLSRITVVPEGFAQGLPFPIVPREKAPTFLFVGRLSSNKRPDHAIRAYLLIKQLWPTSQMWVVGDGPMKHELITLAGNDVRFFGRVPESVKWELLSRGHVLLATSVREGWGLVVSEAAAVGTPCCGYDVPGLRDSISQSGGRLCVEDPRVLAGNAISVYREFEKASSNVRLAGVQDWQSVALSILSLRESCFPSEGNRSSEGYGSSQLGCEPSTVSAAGPLRTFFNESKSSSL